MKRIANKVSVQTVCYTISGAQYIRIVDYPNLDALRDDSSADGSGGTTVFDDVYNGQHYSDWKAFHSECRHISAYHAPVTGLDIIIFRICMAEEQY